VITARGIVERIQSLPPLSATVTRLKVLLAKEAEGGPLSVEQLEKVIRYDPALTTNLLRVANSAYYRGKYPITSARAAIVRLGTNGLFEMAMGMSLRRVLPPMLPGYDLSAQAFVRHAVAVGVLCERLGRETGQIERDSAFTLGLLHDIGKLVASTYLAEQTTRVEDSLENSEVSFEEMEKSILDFDHGEVGLEIARQWRLSPAVGYAARWHHQPEAAPEGAARQVASVVHLADGIAHLLGYGQDVGGMHRRMRDGVPDQLGLQAAAIDRIISDTLEPIDDLSEALMLASQ
jgi:putative nucleotidyltransferase with HDIG domain